MSHATRRFVMGGENRRDRRRLLLFVVAVLCAVAAPSAGARPVTAAPKLKQKGPPPAWLETRGRSRRLAYSSYCWQSSCVGMVPPQSRRDLPAVHIPRGQLIRFRLAFRPREAHVTVFHGLTFSHYELRPGRILFWRAQPGVVLVDVKARAGSASYLVRLTS